MSTDLQASAAPARALVLFTTNHPYTYTGGETMFVEPELAHLAAAFDDVCVVPLHAQGMELSLPAGVGLNVELSARWQRRAWWHALMAPAWPGFWPELLRGCTAGGVVGAARVWRWAAVAHACRHWMRRHLQPGREYLLYTYWRGGQTLAAVRWQQEHPACAAVTRVHRYELYDDAFDPPFQPWTAVYERLRRVIAISHHGADYLRSRGVADTRLRLARLGVEGMPRRAAASTDGVWRVLSCSTVGPPKQVQHGADALCALARQNPERRYAWTHYGDGPAMPALRAALQPPPNLSVTLAGRVPNDEVRAHYAQQPVDLFILLSDSEGLPVALQEALAAGVPVLASDVGGVREAVDDNVGLLLAPGAPLADVVAAMARLLHNDDAAAAARRDAAWQRWSADFNADRNHAALATALAQIER